jgi:GNAT superfamily N-acetyltransferase
MITVRPTAEADLPRLADIWYEKWVLLSQADQRVRLASDAKERWKAAAASWLAEADVHMVSALTDEMPIGYAVGRIADAPPGLITDKMGAVMDIALDGHRSYPGAARMLVSALRAWFSARGIEQIIAWTARRHPVEQAFWRSLGAVEWMDGLWLRQ